MPNTVLIGAQWGDEGKGKIVDVLTEGADLVVRMQGETMPDIRSGMARKSMFFT